jgi:hypothetical protein
MARSEDGRTQGAERHHREADEPITQYFVWVLLYLEFCVQIHLQQRRCVTERNLIMNANDIALTQVDQLGLILAQIAELEAKADAIKASIKDAATLAGASNVFEGNLFKATVVEANRKTVDWKAIQKICNIPEDVIIDNTKITAVFSVKTTTR